MYFFKEKEFLTWDEIKKRGIEIYSTIIIERDKPVRGITSNYIRVEVPDVHMPRNTWLSVRLKSYSVNQKHCIAARYEEK